MPCPSITIGDLVAAMARRRMGDERIGAISWQVDEAAMRVFVGRPEEVDPGRGMDLGLPMDQDIDAIIESFVEAERQSA